MDLDKKPSCGNMDLIKIHGGFIDELKILDSISEFSIKCLQLVLLV